MKRWISCLSVALIIAIGFMLIVTPVVKAQEPPDSTPTAAVYIYRNILESGDFGAFIYANIPYASTPDTPVNYAFIWSLIDTDNVTELGATTGYAYNDSGYGYNPYWLYWSAADAPTWNQAYFIRLTGNPTVFTEEVPVYNFTVSLMSYSSLTAQADVRTEIANRILITAADLDVQWGRTADTSLLTQLETGTVLSHYGENVFRGAIYGCQAIAPAVFRFIADDISTTDRTFISDYGDNVSGQWAGYWPSTAQSGGADFFGKSYDLLSIIIVALLAFGVLYCNARLSGNAWSGLIDVAVLLIFTARLGLYEMAFICFVAGLFWIYDSARLWGVLSR